MFIEKSSMLQLVPECEKNPVQSQGNHRFVLFLADTRLLSSFCTTNSVTELLAKPSVSILECLFQLSKYDVMLLELVSVA